MSLRGLVVALSASVLLFAAPARADEDRKAGIVPAIAGTTLFAGAYIPAAYIGVVSAFDNLFTGIYTEPSAHLGDLAIPVLGPFLYAMDPKEDTVWNVRTEREIANARVLAVTSGVLQIAGLTLMGFGLAAQSSRTSSSLTVAPLAHKSGAGLSLFLRM